LAPGNPLKALGLQKEETTKAKIGSTIKEIELHRRELENLRGRLAIRRKGIYDTTVRALVAKDKSKATVYSNEWSELRKVEKVVYVSELALTQVILRLESINDVGDVMAHMSTAFKVLRRVSKTVQGLVPALDQASADINNTLTETMAEMGNVSPQININIATESGEALVEEARKYAEEQAEEMSRKLAVPPKVIEQTVEKASERVPLLAAGGEDEERSILGVLYSPSKGADTEEQVLKYASIHGGAVDVTDASSVLNIPPDEVEHAMLKLVSEERVKLIRSGEE
jgi:division protein CdvB (Snf7/Vps24/ESCRT-III family)